MHVYNITYFFAVKVKKGKNVKINKVIISNFYLFISVSTVAAKNTRNLKGPLWSRCLAAQHVTQTSNQSLKREKQMQTGQKKTKQK